LCPHTHTKKQKKKHINSKSLLVHSIHTVKYSGNDESENKNKKIKKKSPNL